MYVASKARYLNPKFLEKKLMHALDKKPDIVKELKTKASTPVVGTKQTIKGPVPISHPSSFGGQLIGNKDMSNNAFEAAKLIKEGQRTGQTIKPNFTFKKPKPQVSGAPAPLQLPAIREPQLPAVIPKPKNIKVGDPKGRISSALNTFTDHAGKMVDSISQTGLGKFAAQSAMYGTFGAAAEGGLSVLQGNDPWGSQRFWSCNWNSRSRIQRICNRR
jgi:hypothetical protein